MKYHLYKNVILMKIKRRARKIILKMDEKKKRGLFLRRKSGVYKRKASRYHSPPPPQRIKMCDSSTASPGPSVPSDLLADFFECPVCRDYALPPIYQCNAGHLICSVCRPRCEIAQEDLDDTIEGRTGRSPCPSPLCPTCRQPLETIRNMALEKISTLIRFPCKFSTFGCTEKLSASEKSAHENSCRFKVINCPAQNCEWVGGADELKNHISRGHNEVTTLYGRDIVFLAADILTPAPTEWLMMQETHEETFLVVLKKMLHENVVTFCAYTVALGIQRDAKKFAYRLALNADDKRLSWEAIPKSILDESSVWESECFKIDNETVLMFSQDNDLTINAVISSKSDYSSEPENEDEN